MSEKVNAYFAMLKGLSNENLDRSARELAVREKGEVRGAIEEMLKTEGPVVMDAHVDPNENVFPMVAAGKSLHEMEMGGLS